MSLMLMFIRYKPNLRSSVSMLSFTLARNLSRSEFNSSIVISAITIRIWPYTTSVIKFCLSSIVNPSIRSAAFCITSGSVLIATVIVVGTSTRMFWADNAPVSLHSICIGFMDRNSYPWIIGHTKAAPPWYSFADFLSPPVLPYTTRTSSLLHLR